MLSSHMTLEAAAIHGVSLFKPGTHSGCERPLRHRIQEGFLEEKHLIGLWAVRIWMQGER